MYQKFNISLRLPIHLFLNQKSEDMVIEKLKECYFKLIDNKIPCFAKIKISKITNYEVKQASLFDKNFLDWLLGTFKTNEKEFRKTSLSVPDRAYKAY